MLTRLARRTLPRVAGIHQPVAQKSTVVDTGKSYDTLYEDVQISKSDKSQRAFTYLTLGGARFLYASAGRLAVMKFIATMSASADVLALSSSASAAAAFDIRGASGTFFRDTLRHWADRIRRR